MSTDVIIPAYNAAQHIDACLSTIQQQTLAPNQIIIVDDGSSDSTFARCQELARTHANILLKKHDRNLGLPSARNTGLKFSTAKYVLFIDADDRISNNYIQALCDTAQQTQADIVLASLIQITRQHK